jgi:cyanophycinase
MAGDIGLVGGEEFRVRCEEMDVAIMAASGQNPARVVVIPTAAVTGPAKAANDGVTHFGKLGGNSEQLMVLEREHADDTDFVRAVSGAGVIYFTGGSPDHLLATLRGSKLLEAIQEAVAAGTVLAGSSAGAMVMGEYMRRPRQGGWVPALGLTPGVAVLPHHENADPGETSQQLQEATPAGVTILGIDARTGCLGRPGNWQVVGAGKVTVYQGKDWAVYQSGAALPSDV